MRKKLSILLAIVIVVILLVIFIKTSYKFLNSGNNMSNKSLEEIKEYILNIESYDLVAEITVNSNKNSNRYVVKQQYIKSEKIYRQEFIEPEMLCGLIFTYNGLELKLEGTNFNLTKIYKNYPYSTENNLTLNSFIEDYISSDESKYYEKDGQLILETTQKNGNRYIYNKKLYIDKLKGNPTKIEVLDITQKTVINILYNEVKINDLQKEDILAFKLVDVETDI